MSSKATELIKSEHRQVEALFARFEQAQDRAIVLELCDVLDRHTAMEEQVLYPQLKAVDEELFDDAVEEHEEADEIIGQLRQTDDLARLNQLVAELKEKIEHHVEDEETEDLPEMEESCGMERMDELGEQMERWKELKLAGASDKEALLDLTKDELYDKAKDAEIDGRSSMTKDELADELAD